MMSIRLHAFKVCLSASVRRLGSSWLSNAVNFIGGPRGVLRSGRRRPHDQADFGLGCGTRRDGTHIHSPSILVHVRTMSARDQPARTMRAEAISAILARA